MELSQKEKDPNAMDTSLGALTIEQRTEMMKKGLCFGCGKHGHLSRDCPDKNKLAIPSTATPSSSSPPSYSLPKKMSAKELYTHIQSLTALMNEEEKGDFYDKAEKEGFYRINVGLSSSGCFLCKISNNQIEFLIHSHFDQKH